MTRQQLIELREQVFAGIVRNLQAPSEEDHDEEERAQSIIVLSEAHQSVFRELAFIEVQMHRDKLNNKIAEAIGFLVDTHGDTPLDEHHRISALNLLRQVQDEGGVA